MKRAAHGWIALRAYKLIDDISVKGKIENVYHTNKLIELLSYYLSSVWDGAWIPDNLIGDMKYGHIFKQTNYPELLGPRLKDERSKTPYKELKSRLKGKRLCLKYLEKKEVLNEHYWSKEGHLPNRVIALTHTIGDMLKLGDFPLAFYLREKRRGAYESADLSAADVKSLSLSPTFSARQIATTFFMLSHYIVDAHMPLHCDYRDYSRPRRVRPIPLQLHPSIEEEWEKSFPKEQLIEIGEYSKRSVDEIVTKLPKNSLIKIDKEEDYKLSGADGFKKANTDAWKEMVNICRVSYGLSRAWIDKENTKEKKSAYADVRELIKKKGKEEFTDITNRIFHDAVESVARIWLLVWKRFTKTPRVLFIGNKENMEVHRHNCSWLELVKPSNKVKFTNLVGAHSKGFNNCDHCLGS